MLCALLGTRCASVTHAVRLCPQRYSMLDEMFRNPTNYHLIQIGAMSVRGGCWWGCCLGLLSTCSLLHAVHEQGLPVSAVFWSIVGCDMRGQFSSLRATMSDDRCQAYFKAFYRHWAENNSAIMDASLSVVEAGHIQQMLTNIHTHKEGEFTCPRECIYAMELGEIHSSFIHAAAVPA